jgi:hypothetical protein
MKNPDLKPAVIFKPCKDGEETVIFMPLSIQNRGAPHSERDTPLSVGFHGSV